MVSPTEKIRELLDQVAPNFEKGGSLEKLYPLFELIDTGMFTPGTVTKTSSHVRDGLDLTRRFARRPDPANLLGLCLYVSDCSLEIPKELLRTSFLVFDRPWQPVRHQVRVTVDLQELDRATEEPAASHDCN